MSSLFHMRDKGRKIVKFTATKICHEKSECKKSISEPEYLNTNSANLATLLPYARTRHHRISCFPDLDHFCCGEYHSPRWRLNGENKTMRRRLDAALDLTWKIGAATKVVIRPYLDGQDDGDARGSQLTSREYHSPFKAQRNFSNTYSLA